MAAEIRQPTPEVPIDPTEALHDLKKNPCFENRLMATFAEQRIDARKIQASRQGDRVTVQGPLYDHSQLSLRLNGSKDTKYWTLLVQNLHRHPHPDDRLASISRHNGIGWNDYQGALEGGYHGGLSNPDAADVLRVLADISDMDRRTRNIHSILEGYPAITDPIAQSYIKLIGDFSDPTRLRVAEEWVATPPEKVAGIIDDPRMIHQAVIILNLHGRSNFSRENSPFCWVHWYDDRGEKPDYDTKQTVFSFDPNRREFYFGQYTIGLKLGTVRQEMSSRMLASLNGISPNK